MHTYHSVRTFAPVPRLKKHVLILRVCKARTESASLEFRHVYHSVGLVQNTVLRFTVQKIVEIWREARLALEDLLFRDLLCD
jgi:hypothetical protein